MSQHTTPVRGGITREHLLTTAALTLSLLVLATSVEAGQALVQAAVTAVTTYGTALLAGALVLALKGPPVSLRATLKASRTVLAVAVVAALVLYSCGRSLWSVIA